MNESCSDILPYGRHSLDNDDINAVVDVLRGDWLTTGPKIEQFEQALAATVNAKEAVVCSSGTTALHLAVLGVECAVGDAIIVPAQTFLATANACRYAGAEVIFADVDPETGLMTTSALENAINQHRKKYRIRAIFVVHLGGQGADLEALSSIADRERVPLLEDACHALGGETRTSIIGDCRFSRMAAFSFHPLKTICMGEGGALTLNDTKTADRLRCLRSHGMNRDAGKLENTDLAFAPNGEQNLWYYEMSELGYNFRATDFQCALGLNQLTKLKVFLSKRQKLIEQYRKCLEQLDPLVKMRKETTYGRSANHLAVVHIDFNKTALTRTQIMKELRKNGINTQVHYIPVHLQPYYVKRYGKISLPGAEAYYESCLTLPLYTEMVPHDVERIVRVLGDIIGAS